MSHVGASNPVNATSPLREPIFEKASLLRRIRDVFYRVRDLLHTLASYFRTLKVDAGDSQVTPRIRQLRMLSDMSIQAYLGTIEGENMTFDYRYLSDIESSTNTANLIGIPVILKGTFRKHIVGIVIDKQNKTLEFYDSKGLTIMDRKNDTLLHGGTLVELVSKLGKDYSIAHYKENKEKHQTDCHNCGVYVSHFFKQRAENKCEVLTYQQANGAFREHMIASINLQE